MDLAVSLVTPTASAQQASVCAMRPPLLRSESARVTGLDRFDKQSFGSIELAQREQRMRAKDPHTWRDLVHAESLGESVGDGQGLAHRAGSCAR